MPARLQVARNAATVPDPARNTLNLARDKTNVLRPPGPQIRQAPPGVQVTMKAPAKAGAFSVSGSGKGLVSVYPGWPHVKPVVRHCCAAGSDPHPLPVSDRAGRGEPWNAVLKWIRGQAPSSGTVLRRGRVRTERRGPMAVRDFGMGRIGRMGQMCSSRIFARRLFGNRWAGPTLTGETGRT